MPQLANCPHCHARNQGGKFCVDCGKKIIVDVICKQCDTVWPSVTAFKFCPNCGSAITEYADAASLQTPAEQAAEAALSAEVQAQSKVEKPKAAETNGTEKPVKQPVPIKKPKIAASKTKKPKKKPKPRSK